MNLFGIRIDNLTMDRAVAEIVAATHHDVPPKQVSFVNADCVNLAHKNPEYRTALAESSLVLADGIGMKIAGPAHSVTVANSFTSPPPKKPRVNSRKPAPNAIAPQMR